MNLSDFKRLIRPLQNKIFLLLGRAVLMAINNENLTQEVQISALEGELISDMERFQEYGFETYPLTGAEVLAVFLNGNRDHGFAVCIHDRRYRPQDLAEGEVVIYTDEDATTPFRITMKRGRIAEIKCQDLNIIADGDVSIVAGGNITETATGNHTTTAARIDHN